MSLAELLSLLVTVIRTVPCAKHFTKPLASTVATFVLELVHVTALFVAFAGAIVAVSCTVSLSDK